MSETINNIKNYEPGFRLGRPLTLDLIDTADAESGDTLIYQDGVVSWQQASALVGIVNISSTQLLNMYTSPIELIPAPGSGKYIVVDKIVMKYTYGSVAYTQPGNTNAIEAGNNIVQFGNVLSGGSSFVRQASPTSVVLAENTALQLVNTTGNLTNGDGTVQLYVYYSIQTF